VGSLVVEVRDEAFDWNDGRFALESSAEGASCRRTTASPDIVLSVNDLGALYLGGNSFAALARAGRVHELVPGAVARGDAMFRSAPAPWNPTIF